MDDECGSEEEDGLKDGWMDGWCKTGGSGWLGGPDPSRQCGGPLGHGDAAGVVMAAVKQVQPASQPASLAAGNAVSLKQLLQPATPGGHGQSQLWGRLHRGSILGGG